MRIKVNNSILDVGESQRIKDAGMEADLYAISNNKLLKKYFSSDLIEQERKVGVLCNLASYFENYTLKNSSIAYPIETAYEEFDSTNQFCGFVMNYFSNCYTMEKAAFDLLDNKYQKAEINDTRAVKIIYELFRLLDYIHYKKIILGDIKPANILINPENFNPVIVDFDSAQVPPNFPCGAITPEYLDPRIEEQGKNANGFYTVSTDSDIYSLTVVAYEFIVGMLPYDISIEPALTEVEAKNQNVNLLVFHKHKLTRLRNGFELQHNNNTKSALARLDILEKTHKELYEFLCTILVFDKRQYLARCKKQSIQIPSKPRRFISIERKYNNKDPKELLALINSYNLTI